MLDVAEYSCKYRYSGDWVIVAFTGDIDNHESDMLDVLLVFFNQAKRYFVIDLTEADYIFNMSLSVLVTLKRRLIDRGEHRLILVVEKDSEAEHKLSVTVLDHFIEVVNRVPEAIEKGAARARSC